MHLSKHCITTAKNELVCGHFLNMTYLQALSMLRTELVTNFDAISGMSCAIYCNMINLHRFVIVACKVNTKELLK